MNEARPQEQRPNRNGGGNRAAAVAASGAAAGSSLPFLEDQGCTECASLVLMCLNVDVLPLHLLLPQCLYACLRSIWYYRHPRPGDGVRQAHAHRR